MAGALPVIKGVSSQMSQLFFNLVGNALKFSRAGVPPLITISVADASDEDIRKTRLDLNRNYFRITVADNGVGFNPKFAEQIFTIFQRLHDRTYPGSGIGLTICRRIANNHGGEIFASSVEGQGAQFHVLLPSELIQAL